MPPHVLVTSSRARRALVAAAAAVLLAGCADDDPARTDVERYVTDANALQQRSAPEFERANEVYSALAKGDLPGRTAGARALAAEQALRDARARLGRLRPPAPATALHDRLLRVFDLNAAFAAETTSLARYVPAARRELAPVRRISRQLRTRLRGAAEPDAQAEALRRYAEAISRRTRAMGRLQPPPVLADNHRLELERLRDSERLARRLRTATAARDAPRVARLLIEFRKAADGGGDPKLARRAVRAYEDRRRAVTDAVGELRREQARVERRLD